MTGNRTITSHVIILLVVQLSRDRKTGKTVCTYLSIIKALQVCRSLAQLAGTRSGGLEGLPHGLWKGYFSHLLQFIPPSECHWHCRRQDRSTSVLQQGRVLCDTQSLLLPKHMYVQLSSRDNQNLTPTLQHAQIIPNAWWTDRQTDSQSADTPTPHPHTHTTPTHPHHTHTPTKAQTHRGTPIC